MEVDLALLADAATIDGSGKLNILGVFDRVSASAFPAQHGRMAMVLRFAAGLPEAGPHEVGIRLSGPDGVEVLRLDGEMQLAPGPLSAGGGVKVPHVLNLDGIVFTRAWPLHVRRQRGRPASRLDPAECDRYRGGRPLMSAEG